MSKEKTVTKSGSTQKFTQIQDIRENIVLLEGGNACLVIEIQATNFSLLSPEEQHAKLNAYASILNSLSFQIQVVIRNKRVDISSYIKRIDAEIQKAAIQKNAPTNPSLPVDQKVQYITRYREFIEKLTHVNTVLDKKFYIVLSYSFLEQVGSKILHKDDLFVQAKSSLHTKAESLMTEIGRLSLRAKVLEKQELVELYYDIYNQESGTENIDETTLTPVVRGTQ